MIGGSGRAGFSGVLPPALAPLGAGGAAVPGRFLKPRSVAPAAPLRGSRARRSQESTLAREGRTLPRALCPLQFLTSLRESTLNSQSPGCHIPPPGRCFPQAPRRSCRCGNSRGFKPRGSRGSSFSPAPPQRGPARTQHGGPGNGSASCPYQRWRRHTAAPARGALPESKMAMPGFTAGGARPALRWRAVT